MPEEFSYDQDIAPRTTAFFRGLQSDRTLTPGDKREIATSFFKDISQIRKVREDNQLAPLRLQSAAIGVEAARFNLERARKDAEIEDRVGSLSQEADDVTLGILDDPDLLPEEKAAALRRAQFDTLRQLPPQATGAASWLTRKFGAALNTLAPQAQSDFTPSQIARFVADGGDPAVIETGDPVEIGRAMSAVAARKQQAVEDKAAAEDAERQAYRADREYRDALDSIPSLDFAVDEYGTVDETRFKGGDLTVARLKRALSLSPDPQVRALLKDAGSDVKKLKAAALKAYEGPSTSATAPARPALPSRP